MKPGCETGERNLSEKERIVGPSYGKPINADGFLVTVLAQNMMPRRLEAMVDMVQFMIKFIARAKL